MPCRPRLIALLLTLLLLLPAIPAIPATARAQDATPDAADTRLMLSHNARFTAEIPSTWGIDRAQNADYISADGNGYIVATSYRASIDSLTDACQIAASEFAPGANPWSAVTWTSFRGQMACRLEEPDATGAANEALALVFMHPNPLRSSVDDSPYFTYIGIMVDRADYDAVFASLRFDLEDVTPELYLTAAIDIMQAHAFISDDIDWDQVRADAAAAITTDDPQPGMEIAFAALEAAGDDHSYQWDATQFSEFVGTGAEDIQPTQLPASLVISDQISYLNLPPIQGDESVYELYATAGNTALAEADSATTCGWIIDLRTNFGGNSQPMIAAVGELLGDGVFGGLAFSDGTERLETYADGTVYPATGEPGDSLISGTIYTPEQPDAAVAILIGPLTGSAGEYTGIAFHGREQTAYVGEPSADLTTGISGYLLADGGALGLATSAMVDREETPYPDGLTPDIAVEFDTAHILDADDPVTVAATDWLLEQPACQ